MDTIKRNKLPKGKHNRGSVETVVKHRRWDDGRNRVAKPAVFRLANFTKLDSRFLAKSKEYDAQLLASMGRYGELQSKRVNLFAFIVPAGCGKSHLARKYGMVDVDLMISTSEHDYYVEERLKIMNGIGEWSEHNRTWYNRINQTLDLLDYSMPVMIFVHTEEAALELGAKPIAYLTLTEAAHSINIRGRDKVGRYFSKMNWEESTPSDRVPNQFRLNSNRDLEAKFLEILNLSNIPVACPFKFSEAVWNGAYSRDVPSWVLKGERAGSPSVNINELRLMFESGMIPKECIDYYVYHSYVPTQFDFGVRMFEWANALAELPICYNKPRSFDKESDMIKVFPPKSPKELSRANVTVRHLIQTFDIFDFWDTVEIGEHHVGESQVFVASILSAWKGIIMNTKVARLVYPWFKVKEAKWSDRMKTMHSLIRCSRFFMNTEIDERERQALMYMDLLVGRAEYKIDELGEVALRQSDTYDTKHLSYDPKLGRYTNAQYKKDFISSVENAYSRFKTQGRPVNTDSFMSFYDRRATWLTKGGLVSNTMPSWMKEFSGSVLDSVANTVHEIKSRHNKKSLFEVQDIWDILRGVNEHNFNITKTMIKYETGRKDRTLLPGSLAHFIVFTYILVLAEKQEQVGSVRLNAMKDVDIEYFDKKMGTGIYHVLYDWADFNEQHSAWEMATVVSYLGSVVQAPRDYAIFVEAIVEGMYTMGLQDRDGKVHKIWKGLYSGWRGTTWINTVLNFCYVFIALLNMERIHGVSVVLMVDHGGDDIDLMLSQPEYQPEFLRIMDDMLFKANKWKQLFGVRSEFFRNTISGAQVYASPTRALASFIAGDWEGAGNATVAERITGLLDQIGKMRRRGLSNEMCQGLTMCTISHWCKVKDGEEWINLPSVIIHGSVKDGGLGVPDKDNNVWRLDK